VIVFHLGDRNVIAVGDVAIATGEDADIDIRALDHLQRHLDRAGIARGQMLHHVVGREARAFAGEPRLFAMLGQIERGARNHHAASINFLGHCLPNRMNL
jgi:hypothetical protein